MAALSWLADSLAALMLLTSAYCLSRLTLSWRHRRPTDRLVDAVHVMMGVAMAGMLVPSLRAFWVGGWEIVFGAGVVLFVWRMISDARVRAWSGHRPGHHLQHVLHCAAMVYMLAAATAAAKQVSGGSAMGGTGGGPAHFRTLALVLALGLFGYVVWNADRITSLAPVAALRANQAPGVALAAAGGGELPASTGGLRSAGESHAGQRTRAPLSPRLAACCEIVLGVAMGYMLITML